MNKRTLAVLLLVFAIASCAHGTQSSTTSTDQTSPTVSPSPTASPSPAAISSSAATPQSVNYTDLTGIFGAKEIMQLASLGVFGDATGAFEPAKSLSRREFVRWMFKANNAIWASDATKLIHPAQGEDSLFTDIKSSDPDAQYIQGLQDAGISVGFPDKTFRPDQPITREQALAMKAALDRGGVEANYVITKKDPSYGYYNLPDWKDKKSISPEYVGAIATGVQDDKGAANEAPDYVLNIERTFGAIAALNPKARLTRGQAAIMLWRMGPHARSTQLEPARTAGDALLPPSSATATP